MTDIPQEWVEAACLAYHETFVGEPAPSKRAAKINAIPMKAALAAVIPLVREDAERERDRYREALEEIEDRLLLNGGCFARRLVEITRQALQGDKGK